MENKKFEGQSTHNQNTAADSNPPTETILESVSPDSSSQQAPLSQVITVVRDPDHPLGKKLNLSPDGTISKQAFVNVSFGIAVQHQINNCNELADLLKEIGDDPHVAIINSSFNGIEIGEEFIILSAIEIEKRLNLSIDDRDQQKGVHSIEHDGKTYKAVGRFKENVAPSCWQYMDRDVDEHTPSDFASLSFEEWKTKLDQIIPDFADISWCHIPSTSSRVQHDSKPIGGGNGHLWFKVENPEDLERFRVALVVAATSAGMSWQKPRHSRKNPGTVVGHSLTTIFDPSVLILGRLVFYGKPVVDEGLTVEPLSAKVHEGMKSCLDTSLLELPTPEKITEVTEKAGVQMEVTSDKSGLRILASDLTLETELETQHQGIMAVREILEQGISGKIRCQTPFRGSSSFAAFFDTGSDGKPFVYDSGTGITHWLVDAESKALELVNAKTFAKGLLEKCKDDCGAPYEPEALQVLKVLKTISPAEYQRTRAKLKRENHDISLMTLDAAVKKQSINDEKGKEGPETHHRYALAVLNQLTVGGQKPVCFEDSLHLFDHKENIWVPHPFEKVVRIVAEKFDGNSHCARSTDYAGIANHVLMLARDDTFFETVAIGLACPNGFYEIKDNEVHVVPLTPEHRQRVKINVTPAKIDTPMFFQFLHETFRSESEEEKQQQILLQEIAGAIMVGVMAKFQKAILFYDPFGRAGKGTIERILRELVPSDFVTAVSPFNWGNEYYLASLIGSRFNPVGELPDSKPIPAAAFKTVVGGDLLMGRHPTHRPVTFRNEAGHLFMSNHLINTQDHSEAFFTRWLLVEFPNSRLRSGLPIDTDLADRIIENELPGIAYWALQGAKRLLLNGKFSQSIVHDRLMEKWRRRSNSLEEFIHERCELSEKLHIRRSDFYKEYKEWSVENGRKPFSKGKVKELLTHNISLGITHTSLDGYEIFRGVKVKPDSIVPGHADKIGKTQQNAENSNDEEIPF